MPGEVDDTLELILEISEEQEPGAAPETEAAACTADAESLPPAQPSEPSEPTQPAQAAQPAEPVEAQQSTPLPELPEDLLCEEASPQAPRKRGLGRLAERAEGASPFFPPLKPPSAPACAPLVPPKRPKFIHVSSTETSRSTLKELTAASLAVYPSAVAAVLEELLRQVKPEKLQDVPKLLRSNVRNEHRLLRRLLDDLVVPLPCEGQALSQTCVLKEVLNSVAQRWGLSTRCQALTSDVTGNEPKSDAILRDFLERVYALIDTAVQKEHKERSRRAVLREPGASSPARPGGSPCEAERARRLQWARKFGAMWLDAPVRRPFHLEYQAIEMFE